MANNTQFDPQNPDALFSPDQWLNQFSNFNNAALPWPSSYSGTPTDAMGNPIKPPPGMTLNSSPAAPPPPAPAAPPQQQYGRIWEGTGTGGAAGGQNAMGSGGPTAGQNVSGYGPIGPAPQQAAPQAAPQAAAPTAPNNWQNTMAMLANPGKVNTPGATVPATASAQPGPGSLQAFLANWKPAQSGVGSGFQQGFAGALKGMGY